MLKTRRLLWGLGSLLLFFSAAYLVPTIVSLIYDLPSGTVRYRLFEVGAWHLAIPETTLVFLLVGIITAMVGLFLQMLGVEEENLREREAYAIVGIGWLLVAISGAIPYMALGVLPNPVDALFESMSGFTTTGATVLPGPLDRYPPSLHIWRAFEQWVGGMGIIVLSIAILATLTHGGHQLMAAETPGMKHERVRPKVTQVAKLFWSIYVLYSLVIFVGLFLLIHYTGIRAPWGEAFYEALLHTFTAASSGGFSNHDESIAYFSSVYVEIWFMLAMFVVGISFTLHYLIWSRRSFMPALQDPETRFYTALCIGVSLFVTGVLIWMPGVNGETVAPLEALRIGFVQTIAIVTSTGYAPAVFDQWPDAARLVLLFMFFTGGAAGSTAGGLKVVRILVLFKLVIREVRKLLHPRAVVPLRLGKSILNDDVIKTVSVFFFTYVSLFILGAILLTLMGLDFITAVSASASAIGNIGPALGSVHLGYQEVVWPGKLLLLVLMWFGRLEIFTVLLLFSPATWRR